MQASGQMLVRRKMAESLESLSEPIQHSEDKNKSLTVFSALYDRHRLELRLIVFVIPGNLGSQLDTGYISSGSGDVKIPCTPELPLWQTWDTAMVVCHVHCNVEGLDKLSSPKVRVLADNFFSASQTIEMIEIHSKPQGVGMCVGPVASERPTTVDWLGWYTNLGVARIHAYLPVVSLTPAHVTKITDVNAKSVLEALKTNPEIPFSHSLLSWHAYRYDVDWLDKLPLSYFGQTAIYNDCLMRYRYVYKYLAFFDMDEFLLLRDHHHDEIAPAQRLLLKLLEHHDTDEIAEFTLYNVWAPIKCNKRTEIPRLQDGEKVVSFSGYEGGPLIALNEGKWPDMSECVTGKWCHPKPILKPLRVRVQWVHNSAESNGTCFLKLHEKAILSHMRC